MRTVITSTLYIAKNRAPKIFMATNIVSFSILNILRANENNTSQKKTLITRTIRIGNVHRQVQKQRLFVAVFFSSAPSCVVVQRKRYKIRNIPRRKTLCTTANLNFRAARVAQENI